jgi:hypothetical protein
MVAAFSWYEICILRAAVRRMRKKTTKDHQRARQKFGAEWVDGHSTKVELLLQMEKSLLSLERQLKRQHGVDSIDAYYQTHEEKLCAEKLIQLTLVQASKES